MKVLKYCFDRIEIFVSQVLFCTMSVAVAFQLVSRFTGLGFFWTEEVARYSYIWIVFLCISLGEKMRAHFTVTAFTMFLKGRAEAILELFVDIICLSLYLYLFYWSLHYLPFSHVIQSPAMRLPLTIITASLTVGFSLCFIRRLTHTVKRVREIIKGEYK